MVVSALIEAVRRIRSRPEGGTGRAKGTGNELLNLVVSIS